MKSTTFVTIITAVLSAVVGAAETNDVISVAETNAVASVAETNAVQPVQPVATVAADLTEAPAPVPVESPAATNVAESATALAKDNSDEIDLEEVDDAAEAAKRPSIKTNADIEYVDISCDEATLADILRQFRKTTRANIICDDSTNLMKRVSAELRHVPWLNALQSLLNSRGFRLEERGNIYFVNEDNSVEPVFTRPLTLNHASAEDLAKLFNEAYGKKDPNGKLKTPIANAYPGANVVVITANEKTLADCEAIVKAIDKAVAQIYIEARFLELSSAAMHSLGLDWSTLKDWGIRASNLSAGFSMANGKSANYGTALSTRTINDSRNTSTANSNNINADGTVTKTTSDSPTTTLADNTTYQGLIPKEIGSAAKEAISAADMAWRNAYGFSGQLSADEFHIALSAFESLGEGKIFSNPKIIVANGQEARVDMTTKEPNVTVEASYTGTSSQNMNISTKIEVIPGNDKLMFAGEAFFSYGISLTVKPRISPDGLINVEIVPTISQLDTTKGENGYKVISGASDGAVYTKYPIIEVKRLTTNFTMKDGATAVIGGLTQTTESDVDTGIPYLRKIPWIGPLLFGNKSRVKNQNEIIVFVTVGIANPQDLPKNIGLPTNAVLGREYVEGRRFEPGLRDGKAAEILAVDRRSMEEIQATDQKGREVTVDDQPAGTVIITPSVEPQEN